MYAGQPDPERPTSHAIYNYSHLHTIPFSNGSLALVLGHLYSIGITIYDTVADLNAVSLRSLDRDIHLRGLQRQHLRKL